MSQSDTAPPVHADAAAGTSAPQGERIPWSIVLSWGAPVIGLSGLLFFIQFFFLKFATDVLLIAPIAASAIFAIGRAWDAVSDPIVGTWSDRTKTRLGRRRPWMLLALPALGVTVLMVWRPPDLSVGWMIGWQALALLGFYTAFTMYLVPHLSLGAELSTDHHDRSRIFGLQSAFFSFGMIFAFAGMQYVTVSDDPRGAAGLLAMVFLPFALLILLIPPLRVKERPEYQGKGSENPIRALRDVLGNEHARKLLVVQFVQMLGIGVVGVLAPYQFEYILRRPDLIGPLPALFFVFSVASIVVWVRLSRRYGKRDVWVVAMLIAGFAFGLTFFVGEGDVLLIAMILPLAGVGLGCGGVVGPSLLADVIDADELATGERKEGAYNAVWGFALKSSNALVIVLAGVVLQFSGFQPNQVQSDTTLLALRGLFAMPLIGFIGAAFVLKGLSLDEAEHARIRAALDARHAEEG